MGAPANRPSDSGGFILWDVVEEHLDEAAFLWSQRRRALFSPEHGLRDIERGPEPRLRAHVDGLVIAGPKAVDRLLLPALQGDKPEACAAATLALLALPGADVLTALGTVLRQGELPLVGAALEACALVNRADLTPFLLETLMSLSADRQALVLDALTLRGADASAVIRRLSMRSAPALAAAAVRNGRMAPRAIALELVRAGLNDESPEVRAAAIETGLASASRAARAAASAGAQEPGPAVRACLWALAVGGAEEELARVVAALGDPALREEAVWALGFSGSPAAADALIALGEEGGRLAADAFAAITGVSLGQGFLARAPEQDERDEEDDGAVQEEDRPGALPGPACGEDVPDFEALEGWWKQQKPRFDPKRRYLRGEPWSAEALISALETEPARRRPALALELAVRSHGELRVQPFAWTGIQRRQLGAARAAQGKIQLRPFGSFFS